MRVMAQQPPLVADEEALAAQSPEGRAPVTEISERYRQADAHDRLCLWLQFREARPAMDLVEAEGPSGGRRG